MATGSWQQSEIEAPARGPALSGRSLTGVKWRRRSMAPSGATVEASIAWRAPEAGTLQVVIDDTAGLPADNAWFVALGGASPSKVLIVGADEPTVYKAGGRPAALYLSRALSTSSGEDVEVVSGARFAGFTADQLSARRGWRCCRPADSSERRGNG